MASKQTFETVLEKNPTLNATSITIPVEVGQIFGSGRFPAKAEINGAVYRGSVVRMGGKLLLGIPKVFRDEARISAGDHIVVTLERDDEPRVVEVPSDFAKALASDENAAAAWAKLSYTHRKEHVSAIEEAKRPETRVRRIEIAIKMLALEKQ